MVNKRPGGELSTRPLHFIWLCDCSGSMGVNGKIQSLNNAIHQSIPLMREAAADNPNAQVLVRALKFSTGAQWHISQPTPVEAFEWNDLSADGVTDLGKGLALLTEQLKMPPMTDRALPPVLVLLSDGQPTDHFSDGLNQLMQQPWGKKAVRISIAIGQDADYDVLQKFIGHSELQPLSANNPDALIDRIRWVSTAVLKTVSAPTSQAQGVNGSLHVPLPIVPQTALNSANDVW